MFDLTIINALGESYDLTADKRFRVIDIDGLSPVPVNINTSEGSGDGAIFNSAFMQPRSIVITVVFCGDIETTRAAFYRIFPEKKSCTIVFSNKIRAARITGYVETNTIDLFSQRQQAQVSLLCPNPWFESQTSEDFIPSYTLPLFSAPFSIEEGEPIPVSEVTDHPTSLILNSGDVECGFAAEVTFSGAVEGLRFANETAGTWFKLDYSFAAGDKLTLDTRSGRLAVTNLRNGSNVNMLRYMVSGSRWIKLPVGANRVGVTADSGIDNAAVTISVYRLFGGV
jgi:hypothetical protein